MREANMRCTVTSMCGYSRRKASMAGSRYMQVYSLAASCRWPRSRLFSSSSALDGLAAQGQQAQGVLAQEHSRGGQRAIARGAVEESFAHRFFELADYLAHRRLRAVQARRGAGETALLGHGKKGFEMVEFHSNPPECSFFALGCRLSARSTTIKLIAES